MSENQLSLSVALAALLLSLAPASAQDHMLTHFESGSAQYGLGTKWRYSSSGDEDNESKITSTLTPGHTAEFDAKSVGPGYGGSTQSGKLGFVLGSKKIPCGNNCQYDPEVRFETDLNSKGKTVLDLSGATKISFWAKSDKPFKVSLRCLTRNVIDDGYYHYLLDVGTEWKLFSLDLKTPSSFKQPTWADPKVAFDLKTVYGLSFVVSKEDNAGLASGELLVDDIKLHGWSPPAGEDLPSALAYRTSETGVASKAFIRAIYVHGALRISVPEEYRSQAGRIAVLSATGRIVAIGRFAKNDIGITLSGNHGPIERLRFRVISEP